MGNNYIFVFLMSGWLWGLILQAGSSLICWEPLVWERERERELEARIPFCFQDKLTLKWLLQFHFCRHSCFPGLSSPGPEIEYTYGFVWLGRFWKADSLRKKNNWHLPLQPTLVLGILFPPPDTSVWLAGLILCSTGPVCAGKAVKMALINLSERSTGH